MDDYLQMLISSVLQGIDPNTFWTSFPQDNQFEQEFAVNRNKSAGGSLSKYLGPNKKSKYMDIKNQDGTITKMIFNFQTKKWEPFTDFIPPQPAKVYKM